ncbi:MAG: PglZ domain-containing protein [Candidatus Aminicenantes bacterium]|nr:PglZ domain-containing protein [Candidatus Aminicenantes bacterium]NIM80584.1 PglZ domain-containing protein [Candidatus Aminicenantes bacterium]NIN19965.1 PglZ domain-containing protein [Candidatus Aminicenantes bacterium]NIN42593.1 PglZ domain-containing protein [Candidatus Aminicenantes bacterium]NIN86591.1 PglZ domain-containing protein [Candidatus Aminicenantes bacterium]
MSRLDSFGYWLAERIKDMLSAKNCKPVFIIWCDPNLEWLKLLREASKSHDFELWADPEEHELILRDRFYKSKSTMSVIWLPIKKEEITWFKVFELQANNIWEKSLLEALRDYGVNITREFEKDLIPLLPTHALEWFNEPMNVWKELTPGTSKRNLVDDDRILDVLAGEPGEFERLKKQELFQIFKRRATEDYGLPDPTDMDEKNWRIAAAASLLSTEAAVRNPQNPPGEGDYIIPGGLQQENAVKLLDRWQHHVRFIPSFEKIVQEADRTLGLSYWAKNLESPPHSFSSRAVEETLFKQTVTQLDSIHEVDLLAGELQYMHQTFLKRSSGFWEEMAENKIGWRFLVRLSEAASFIIENAGIEKNWKTVSDAVSWYCEQGWLLDQAGEELFLEMPELPESLNRIRARLRRSYQRKIDQIGRTFSDLLSKNPGEIFSQPSAGEVLANELKQGKTPTAILILDAFRLQLGHRLADYINKGEPEKRAHILTAVAPVPSITSLGMAFALPMEKDKLNVSYLPEEKIFNVYGEGFKGNLTCANERRKWLSKYFKIKEFMSIADVLDSDRLKSISPAKSTIVVEGGEFDIEGHEGKLQLTGTEDHLRRYTTAIHRLRNAGYNRILIVTDHGYFHWQPESDEVEEEKPEGDLYYRSRRAYVGHDLKHSSALHLSIPRSDLETMTPRSINAFKTYGGLGYFHGGASLQEIIIPVIKINYPAKSIKTPVVLKPVEYISSEIPIVQVEAGVPTGQRTLFPDNTQLSRRIIIKVKEPDTGKLVFRHKDAVVIEAGGEPTPIRLEIIEPRPSIPYGTSLVVEVIDADDEELLEREKIILKVDIDEW